MVQCLTSIRYEDCGNAKCFAIVSFNYKGRRRRIPGSITAGLESVADAATWKRRSIRFLLYKCRARKPLYHLVTINLEKSIMLFGGSAG